MSVTGAVQTTGVPIPVVVTAKDAFEGVITGFTNPVNLAIRTTASVSANLLGAPSHSNQAIVAGPGITVAYTFTPIRDLTVTHVRHYFGTKVSIWRDATTLVASVNVVSSPVSWTETPLPSPVLLYAGTTYTIGAFVPANLRNYCRLDMPAVFGFATVLNACMAVGDGFPSYLIDQRWPLVDLRFNAQSESQLTISPSLSTSFVHGTWTGTVTTMEMGTNAVLEVAGDGKSGTSGQFNVVLGPPVITGQPDDARRIAGKNLLLPVTATGAGTLAYQWWFNGSPLVGEETATLSLNGIIEGHSGPYWCVVSNGGGAVTSRVARVTVSTALLSPMSAPDVQTIHSEGFQLALETEAGRNYRIEGSTDLLNWSTITNFISDGEAMQFLDRAATNLTRRFYRVVRQ